MAKKQQKGVKYGVAIQESSNVSQDEQIAILADILVEGFIWEQEQKRNKISEGE